MPCASTARAFKLLHPRRRIPVLQPDPSGVICPLLDRRTEAPFLLSTKKLRRALAGKQRQVLCACCSDAGDNAFCAHIDEFVGLDPHHGEYVILSPFVHVLGTRHGDPLMTQAPEPATPGIASQTLVHQIA